jgi:hypothetical protein
MAQYRLRKVIQDAKDQVHECEDIISTNNLPSKPFDSYKTKFQKIIAKLSRKSAIFAIEELKGLDYNAQ